MFAPQSQFSEQQDDTLQMSTKLRKMVKFDLNGSFRMVSADGQLSIWLVMSSFLPVIPS